MIANSKEMEKNQKASAMGPIKDLEKNPKGKQKHND